MNGSIVVTLAMEVENSISDLIGFAAFRSALQPCFGVVRRVLSGSWVILIGREHLTTTCLLDGTYLNDLLLHLPLTSSSISPTLVANLWDVTDKDIDKFSQSVFDKLRLTPTDVNKWSEPAKEPHASPLSLVASVAQSRDSCKLKYLTGAAPVVYGIPFYL